MVTKLARNAVLLLSLLAFLTVLVHGYHLGVDDSEIFVPAIKRAADPGLYPFGSEFFMTHAHMTLFPALVGKSALLSHVRINIVIFAWHVGCIFLLLLAVWQLLRACFVNEAARWCGVAMVAATLSVPIAGTALVIMDPYLTARSLSTPLTIFAVACYVSHKPKWSIAWLILTALIHPQMSLYGAVFIGCLWMGQNVRIRRQAAGLAMLSGLPFPFELSPAHGAAREALLSRAYFFVATWEWYEWVGVFAPLALAWWCSRRRVKGTTAAFQPLLRTFVPFGLLFTAAGLVLTCSPLVENFARLQPMRAFHVLYVVFFAMLGGVIGEYVLRRSVWRWAALFVPLAATMYLVQQVQFPNSAHVEWPGYRFHNAWNSAFFWIRANTPKDAVFALDPNYMRAALDDQRGFRAVAERSALADAVKDSGAVSLFPQLAGDWKSEVEAQNGWVRFHRADFEHLAKLYPVTWIVTASPVPVGLVCPYTNETVSVCRIDAPGLAGSTEKTTSLLR